MAKKRKKLTVEELKEKQPFGKWTVIGEEIIDNKILCRCSCEKQTEKMVNIYNLTGGISKSCSCGKVDACKKNFTKHGMCGTKIHDRWMNMHGRCNNRSDPIYGGKVPPVTVCARWSGEEGFVNFWKDMDEPLEGQQIDRKNNDGGYWCGKPECPECGPLNRKPNCQWVTKKENCNNRDNCIRIPMDGREQTLQQWCEELGHDPAKIAKRHESGMTWQEALTAGEDRRFTPVLYRGEWKTYKELEAVNNIPWNTIRVRYLDHGYTVEEAAELPRGTRLPTYRKKLSQQQQCTDKQPQ